MRLTLRTLLAYLDNILGPSQRDDLQQQIDESDFAADLIHRTQDTTRRLRLTAPQPLGVGVGFDPNSVAEYLDNTLSPEDVSQLERICLESDMHLAEVASCHHILTMVLGTPADIDPQTKQRAYELGPQPETTSASPDGITEGGNHIRIEAAHGLAHQQERVAAGPPAGEPAAESSIQTDPLLPADGGTTYRVDASQAVQEIPEYLRAAEKQRGRQAILAIAGAGLIAVAGILLTQRDFFTAQEAGSEPVDRDQQTAEQTSLPAADSKTDEPAIDDAAATGNDGEINDPASGGATGEDGASGVEPPGESLPQDRRENSVSPVAQPSNLADATDALHTSLEGEPATNGGDLTGEPLGESGPLAGDAATPRERAVPTRPIDSSTRYDETETATPITDQEGADDSLDPLAELPPDVGIYWDDRTVLLRRSPGSTIWIRVPSRTPVEAEDELLSLPAFHPNVALRAGVGMSMSGATRVAVGQTRDVPEGFEKFQISGIPTLRIDFGRVVLVNTSGDSTIAGLSIAGNDYLVALETAATLAVEVRREFVVGKDPIDDPSPLSAMVYAPQGKVVWYREGIPTRVNEPSQWSVDQQASFELRPYLQPIDWLEEEPVNRLEEMAAVNIRDELPPGDSANTAILELLQGTNRKEVKSLAAKAGIYVGEFGPFLATLRDSDQRSAWNDQIDTLRDAIALSPDSAAGVYEALKRERGIPAADDLMEMLRGYELADIGTTPAEQQGGALPRLIRFLEHESLDYRVLAAYNLRQITQKNFLQNPAGLPSDRRRGVQLWRQRLENNQLPPEGLQ